MEEIHFFVYKYSGNNKPVAGNFRQYVHRGGKNGSQSCAVWVEDFSGENLPGAVSSLMISRHFALWCSSVSGLANGLEFLIVLCVPHYSVLRGPDQ